MKRNSYRVKRWGGKNLPSEDDVLNLVAESGLSGYRWSNQSGDVYGAHSHDFDKIIFVIQGSITFGLPAENVRVSLSSGDCLDLARSTVHDAVVGPQGVVCLEVHRQS
jgi:quercetin dioxygenase-like cupin family protein